MVILPMHENLLPTGLKRQRLRRPDSSTKFSMGLFVLFLVLNMSMTKSPSYYMVGEET